MKAFQKFWFLLIVISLSSCSGKSKTFMLVLLPDTQCYTDRYPEIFRSQTSWIADHAGDITSYSSRATSRIIIRRVNGK